MAHTRVVQLLDKNLIAHTVIEDLTPFVMRVEGLETGSEKTNTVQVKLKLNKALKFVKTAPILVGDPLLPHNDQPKDNYLIYAYIEQNGIKSTEFRGYISATEQDFNQNEGNTLTIWATTQDIRAKSTPLSVPLRFFAPFDALDFRATEYNLYHLPELKNPAISIAKNTFPNAEQLKQNWILDGPTPLSDVFSEMIKRLFAVNVAGGVFKQFYARIDPDTAGIGATDNLLLTAEEFGEIDSGVKIAAQTFTPQEEKKIVTDNTRYFNHIILKAGQLGTLPQSYMRFASNFEHARRRPQWDSGIGYVVDDLVQHENRYWKCIQNVVLPPPFPPNDPAHWTEDFVVDASYVKWNNLDDWKANLGGFVIAHPTHAGVFVDHNFVRANYDRQEFTNDFEYITLKDVQFIQQDEPGAEFKYDGFRVLIPNFGGTGAFAGKANQIAEWNVADNEWKFSLPAVDKDMVFDWNGGSIVQYNASTNTWSTPTDFFGDKIAWPVHPVKSVSLVENAKGIANAAVRFRFDWELTENLINAFSRGFWINWFLPAPRKPTAHGALGHEYKNPTFDTDNMRQNSKGELGWNKGDDSLDLGEMKALFLELRPVFEDVTNALIDFMPEEELRIGVGFVDKFFRVTIQDGFLRRNGQYDNVIVPVGKNAPTGLYFNRIEELTKVLGISHPVFDFTLKEREFTGVKFDWNHVRGWFVFWKPAYDPNGAYAGFRDAFIDDLSMRLEQYRENLAHIILNFFGFPRGKTIVHHCYIDIGDWYFIKDMYASSSSVHLPEAITKIIRAEEEDDFNNATLRAQAEQIFATFYPQTWYIEGRGDTRLRRGQRFKAVGPEVPGGEMELVAQEVKHISDGDSYHVQVSGVRIFAPPL